MQQHALVPLLLGGGPPSVTDAAGFIAAPFDTVLATAMAWRSELGWTLEVRRVDSIAGIVAAITPGRRPWRTEAFIDSGAWTTYLNEGSDPVPATGYLSTELGVRAVLAMCSVEPPHASTQFELLGPDGDPPLMYVRSLAAHCEDGRWTWHASGQLQPFEHVERYGRRRVRDRLDRPLLMEYLTALGIEPDEPDFFGAGTVLTDLE